MNDEILKQARETIADADREMARIFVKRMQAAREIAAYKQERGLPILDKAQEQAVIARGLGFLASDELEEYYIPFIKSVMDVSKQYQRRLLAGEKVAYSGVEGAFAHIAARRIFPQAQAVACPDFPSAYRAVQSGECDFCVLPVENSYAGEVGQVTDLMYTGDLHVTGMYTLPVAHHLLALPGADLKGIRRVMSHPQALSQCAGFLSRQGYEAVQASNTARAALEVVNSGDRTIAAIASIETAELYGLEVLAKNINDSGLNATRFAVFSRAQSSRIPAQAAGFLLLFTVNHTSGALAEALGAIASHSFNMRSLRSRPMKDIPWQYYFFAEIEGDDRSERGQRMLEALKGHCTYLKVAGRYDREINLGEANE